MACYTPCLQTTPLPEDFAGALTIGTAYDADGVALAPGTEVRVRLEMPPGKGHYALAPATLDGSSVLIVQIPTNDTITALDNAYKLTATYEATKAVYFNIGGATLADCLTIPIGQKDCDNPTEEVSATLELAG